jgi:hypothetical protein
MLPLPTPLPIYGSNPACLAPSIRAIHAPLRLPPRPGAALVLGKKSVYAPPAMPYPEAIVAEVGGGVNLVCACEGFARRWKAKLGIGSDWMED